MASLLALAKTLVVFPLIGIIFIALAIYGTACEDKWSEQQLYSHDISDLGTTWSKYRIIFAIGFTVASSIIICGSIIKIYLIANIWQLSGALICNMALMSFGAIMLVVMAWTPYDINWFVHMIGAVFGIFITLLALFLDGIYWYKYVTNTHSLGKLFYILTAYLLICLSASLTFFILWIKGESDSYSVDDAVHKRKAWGEWLGLLFGVLGFLTQSVHGICIHQQIKEMDGDENKGQLLVNDHRTVHFQNLP